MTKEARVGEIRFINSIILVKEMVTKVENAKENDDKEVLIAVLKQHIDTICKETFLVNNALWAGKHRLR